MKVRFQADNDLRSSIRNGVIRREPAIDFQSARTLQLDGVEDTTVLRLAAQQGRILVSHDRNTLPAHFHRFLAEGNRSPGPMLVSQDARLAVVIDSLVLI